MPCKVLNVKHCGPIEVEQMQEIIDGLATINTTLMGELTVQPGDQWAALLTASVTSALENANITVDVGNTVNVTVDTSAGPVDVTGTVTVAEPLNVVVSNFPTAFSIDNFADLEALELTVTLDGEVVTVTPDAAFTTLLTDIVDEIANTIRVDYEKTGKCAFDAAGALISPPVEQFVERRYTNLGVFISNTVVLSQFLPDGTITGYTLGAGETVAACPSGQSGQLSQIIDLLTDVIGDPSDPCPCETGCDPLTTAVTFIGFDYYSESDWQPADTTVWDIHIDGVVQSTVVIDYLVATDGVNKSSWYTSLVAAVNALPGWTMTLVTDVPVTGSGRPTWEISFSGTGPQQLRLENTTSGADIYNIDVDAACAITGVSDDGSGFPFGTDPFV